MNEITISEIKHIRESLGATHIVLFVYGEDGKQRVATHGKTSVNADEAADMGNKLKAHLGWPDEICKTKPLKRVCKNCFYWEADYGMHCMNGWSKDGTSGWCKYEPKLLKKADDSTCHCFEPKQ